MVGFWTPWPLWEQMVFVLGCAIVLTILAGCVKLIYNHHQLRKFARVDAEKREVQHLKPPMEEVTAARRGRAEDIPFGVRALESGIEVEGVWHSRPTTPTSSVAGSPTSSSFGDSSPPRGQMIPHIPLDGIPELVMPQPVRIDGRPPTRRSRSSSPARSTDTIHERVPVERFPAGPDLTASDLIPRGRLTYKPRRSSQLRFSSGDLMRSDSSDVTSFRRPLSALVKGSSDEVVWADSPKAQGRVRSPEHYIPKRLTDFTSNMLPQPNISASPGPIDFLPFTHHNHIGLESLASHRVSHAAEVGQLLPRLRGPPWFKDGKRSSSMHNGSAEPSNSLSEGSVRSYSLPAQSPLENRTAGQSPEVSGMAIPSFQSFMDTDPMKSQRQPIPPLGKDVPIEGGAGKQPLRNGDTNVIKRHPEVIRKVNSGFEILRSGSFTANGRASMDARMDTLVSSQHRSRRLHKRSRSDPKTGLGSLSAEPKSGTPAFWQGRRRSSDFHL